MFTLLESFLTYLLTYFTVIAVKHYLLAVSKWPASSLKQCCSIVSSDIQEAIVARFATS